MISIIIIVKNDKRIAKLLEKLCTITKPEKTEIIIVDASQGALLSIKEAFPIFNWVTFIPPANAVTTIPEQRNVGIKNAKGDIIVYIDSDCIPYTNWLVELVKPIREENEKIVAGKVLFSDKTSMHTIEQKKRSQSLYVDEAPTMNLAICKEIFQHIGMFDETFQTGEDVDFAWRARSAGYKIRFCDKALIYHDLGNIKHEFKRMYGYGKARTKLYRKHSDRLRFFWGNEFLTIFYPLAVICLPLTAFFPFYPVIFLIILIKDKKNITDKAFMMKTLYGTGVLKELIFPEVVI